MKRSREECLAQAQAFIDALGLDMLLVRTDVLDLTELQLYRFYFGHNYDGIPSSIGVNDAMRQYSWGLSEGEFMTICVCDAGIYKIQAMLYDVIETKEAQPIISAQEAVTKLIEAAQVYPFPISAYRLSSLLLGLSPITKYVSFSTETGSSAIPALEIFPTGRSVTSSSFT